MHTAEHITLDLHGTDMEAAMPTRTKTVIELRDEYARASNNTRLPPAVVAAGIGLSALTLERWRQTGRGPVWLKRARRVTYLKADVEAWLAEEEVVA